MASNKTGQPDPIHVLNLVRELLRTEMTIAHLEAHRTVLVAEGARDPIKVLTTAVDALRKHADMAQVSLCVEMESAR